MSLEHRERDKKRGDEDVAPLGVAEEGGEPLPGVRRLHMGHLSFFRRAGGRAEAARPGR